MKTEIHRQTAILRVDALRTKAGLKSPTITRHLIFTGNPGTGKTTVARLVAGIYKAIGLLSKGQLVEVDRSELVAGYLGQTAIKTAEVAAKAYGGVLFIDEAYSPQRRPVRRGGDQHPRQGDGGPPRRPRRDRRRLPGADGRSSSRTTRAWPAGSAPRSRSTTTPTTNCATSSRQMAAKADYDLGDGVPRRVQPRAGRAGRATRRSATAGSPATCWRPRSDATPGGCARSPSRRLDQLRTLLPEDLLEPDAPKPATAPDADRASTGLEPPEAAADIPPVEFPAPPGDGLMTAAHPDAAVASGPSGRHRFRGSRRSAGQPRAVRAARRSRRPRSQQQSRSCCAGSRWSQRSRCWSLGALATWVITDLRIGPGLGARVGRPVRAPRAGAGRADRRRDHRPRRA